MEARLAMAKNPGKSIIGIYPGGSEYNRKPPKKPTNPNTPKWQSFLSTHPKKKANYDKLSPEEQLQWQDAFARGGAKAVKRYTQGVLRNRVPEVGQAPTVDQKYDLNDPGEVIDAQEWVNRQNLRLNQYSNRINQTGPMGGQEFYEDPITGRWTQKTTFGAPMQSLYDQLGKQFQTNPFTDVSADRAKAENAVYQNYSSKFEPQFNREQENFRQEMANSGVDPTSEKYRRMQDDMMKRQDEMRRSWANEAYTTGGQEQQRLSQQQIAQYNAPIAAFGNMAGAASTYQKGFNPISQERIENPDVTGTAQAYTQMGPYADTQQQYKMKQIEAQNAGALDIALTNQENESGPGDGDMSVDQDGNPIRYSSADNRWHRV